MARTTIKVAAIGSYTKTQINKLVREAGVDLRNRLIDYSPVGQYPGGGTFKSNWQFKQQGLTYVALNATQNYAEAITFGGSAMPRSWNGTFRSNFGLPERWPEVLAGKETKEQIPSIWSSIVRRT
tara:strand:+ start:345 stop:719 length:375 start_codon:yes stop_codon:yes gene_type:complete